MFEQAFKNIDDVLRKEAGCTTELDYTEQTSWLLFLKYLDSLEQDKADEAALQDFVTRKLFPYLHDFKQKATGPNTIECYTPRPLIRAIVRVVQQKSATASTTAHAVPPASSASPSIS